MNETLLSWVLLIAYAAVIIFLAWRNRRRASDIKSFSVGSRSVPPFFVGLSLAANMTSVATFVINPGLIHAYGWSGVVGYGMAAPLGIFIGLVVTSKRFRRVGDRFTVLTVPQWLGERYGDRRLTVFFAIASMLQVTFLVLIVTALVLVLMSVLQIGMWPALLMVVIFTFGYILFGGASLHVWSNSLQAMTMLAVAVILVVSGAALFGDGLSGFFGQLDAVAPHYGSMTNPQSLLFRDLFEVVVANFVIGLAIIMQPHIISKSLYLRSERDVNTYLVTAMVAGTIFTAVLLVGLYARIELGGDLPPDRVVATYIASSFTPGLRAFIMVGVLAAGFSTLEGVILALSTIFGNDFFGTIARSRGVDEDRLRGQLLQVGRIFLVALAPITLVLAWRQIVAPSLSVAIFAQNGIYGLFAATFAPVLFGIFSKRATAPLAFLSAISALIVHFGMYYGGITPYHNNPAVPATCALAVSTLILGVGVLAARGRAGTASGGNGLSTSGVDT
ncbi:MAG: sodium:solute symporter family protein [Acidobacteria bacterium]|nr:sodium:solute symporter family protein [Acidobacteriota bacterium]